MGQTLEKLPDRDGEPSEDSPQRAADPGAMEAAGQDESRGQDSGSGGSWGGLGGVLPGHAQDTQIGQPIGRLAQQDHARGEQRGGVRGSWSFARTAGELKTFLSFGERRQHSNHSQNSESEAVACPGTAAMEEQRNGRRPEGADAQGGSPAASCDLAGEVGFTGPQGGQTEGERNLTSGSGTRATAAEHRAPREQGRGKPEAVWPAAAGAEADKSSAAACFEREMGQHLDEVTGGRCWLKAGARAGAAHSQTSGGAEQRSRKDLGQNAPPAARESGFAGAVSRRASAGMAARPEGSPGSRRAAAAPPQVPRSPDPCPPLLGSPSVDEKSQTASLKSEGELVCFTAVVSPPPLTCRRPDGDGSPGPCDSGEACAPRAKGPPPPVPKKPKNPFIKLKTAQLSEAQRRSKDLRSEEKIRRRHTFHFNKDAPWMAPKNQDMCSQWDERGPYVAPTGRRPLSVDLSPWERSCLDDQCGAVIDFDYCERIEKLSPDEDLQNLDMLQRRVFLERRSRFRSAPPPPIATGSLVAIGGARRAAPDNGFSPAHQPEVRSEVSNHRRHSSGDGGGSEVDSFKPVAELIKATNQMQKHPSRAKGEGAKAPLQLGEQGPSVKVSQMKSTFDGPKRTNERPAEIQASPKKGKTPLPHHVPESAGAF